jgi:hypothetical protein
MKNSADPSVHRAREANLIKHVEALLADSRLRIDTISGNRSVAGFEKSTRRNDRATDLQRLMSQLNVPDRELRNRMPVGESFEVDFFRRKLILFRSVVGRLVVKCISPAQELLLGQEPPAAGADDIRRAVSEVPPSTNGSPTTIIVVSTSGFTTAAHDRVDRSLERTVILVEPNDAGGWTVHGPTETRVLNELLDPEMDDSKRVRLRQIIEEEKVNLLTSGIAADKLATKSQLSQQLVEAELRAYAKENPGHVAKRIDGRIVLFREGSAPTSGAVGGGDMPIIDRIKSLFARKGETEKKVELLSEQRAAIAQQLDRAYEEIGVFEKKESQLKDEFKVSTSELTKRRVASQMVQLRKDIERRQQLLGVLNQRLNIISTHLHNLELVRQGEGQKMPDTEEIAGDAAAAEEMLAELQANTELAESVSNVTSAGMSAEEQALYEELTKENAPVSPEPPKFEEKLTEKTQTKVPPIPTKPEQRRAEPEAG